MVDIFSIIPNIIGIVVGVYLCFLLFVIFFFAVATG